MDDTLVISVVVCRRHVDDRGGNEVTWSAGHELVRADLKDDESVIYFDFDPQFAYLIHEGAPFPLLEGGRRTLYLSRRNSRGTPCWRFSADTHHMDEAAADDSPELVDPVSIIQDAIAKIGGDKSLCSGFAIVAEWLEDDGSTVLSVLHSPMPPWHMYGLLTYARDECNQLVEIGFDDEWLPDEDEF